MFKFRTMYADAAERRSELGEQNEAEGALFKIRDDPRMTSVGAFLRRLSIDELPNMLNVLRGEMSLVGPRPLPAADYALLEEWHRKRSFVLPGMTGLWQISGRSDLSFDDLVRLDFYYLENWSIWLDITILAKTIPAVLVEPRGLLGAVEASTAPRPRRSRRSRRATSAARPGLSAELVTWVAERARDRAGDDRRRRRARAPGS